VDTLSDTVDVASIDRIPESSSMALVGLRGKEELESDIGRGRGVGQEGVRLVVGRDSGTKVPNKALCRSQRCAVE
jgi:hypothetical protein